MLTIATVQVGNYLGRGAEYVAKLYAGVGRWLPRGIERCHVCLNDGSAELPDGVESVLVEPDITGWWNKLQLFKPGQFDDRVLYFDLDTLPVGDLSSLAAYDGDFAALSDPYWPEHINSSVMAWRAGAADAAWTTWDRAGRPQFDRRGDQRWIEQMMPGADRLQTILPRQFVSFKADCWIPGRIPDDARLIYFHGQPRPHDCGAGFIRRLWASNPPPEQPLNGGMQEPLEPAQETEHAA